MSRRIVIRLLFWGTGALIVVLLWPCILLFLIAYGVASALEPLVGRLARRHIPRPVASGGVLISLAALLGLILWLAAVRLGYELGQFLLQLPALLSRFPSDWLEEKWYALLVAAPSQLREALTAVAEQLLESGQALPSRLSAQLAAQAGQAAAALPSLFLTLITGLLAIFFCSADLPRIRAYLRELIPEEKRGAVASVLSCLRRALLDWCRVQGRLMAVVFGILTVGLLLLRVPYAFLAAGVGALIDALPFFGSGVLLVPWAILSFLQKETGRAIGLLVLYGVICLTRSLLEPRFYGTQTGVSPLVTLLALYGGFHLFGVWGMLLAPVAVSITASLVQAKKNADQPQNT